MHYYNATCFGHVSPSSGNTFIRSLMHCALIEYHSFRYVIGVSFFISFLKCGRLCILLVRCAIKCPFAFSIRSFNHGTCKKIDFLQGTKIKDYSPCKWRQLILPKSQWPLKRLHDIKPLKTTIKAFIAIKFSNTPLSAQHSLFGF
jgi:hypothetical protein